jgi:hypothetical protein
MSVSFLLWRHEECSHILTISGQKPVDKKYIDQELVKKTSTVELGDKELFDHPKIVP